MHNKAEGLRIISQYTDVNIEKKRGEEERENTIKMSQMAEADAETMQ